MAASNGHLEPMHLQMQLRVASDADLMRLIMSKSNAAMAVLVERYHRLIFSVAVRIVKDEGEAEEVLQIVFLDIFRRAAQFDASRGTLKMWVLQHAYSRSVNHRRNLARRHFYSRLELDDVDPSNFSVGLVGSNGLSSGEAAVLLEEALNILNPAQRQVIELVYFEGLTFAEAAEKMGHTMEAARHYYYRGLVKVREVIQSANAASQEKSPAADKGKFRLEVASVRPLKPRTL